MNRTRVRDADGADLVLPRLWRKRRCVVVFLRHFGCRFCKQHTSLMKKLKAEYLAKTTDEKEDHVAFVLVGIGDVSHIKKFREESGWDGELYVVPDVKDTQKGAYGIFKLTAAASGQELLTHPKVSGPDGTSETALRQGFQDGGYPHSDGGYPTEDGGWESLPDYAGNVFQLGGVFVVGPGNMCDFSFRSEYVGHFPDPADILNLIVTGADTQIVADSTAFWADKLGSLCPHKAMSTRELDKAVLTWRDAMTIGALGIAVAGLARKNWLLGLSGCSAAVALQMVPKLIAAAPRKKSSMCWDVDQAARDLKLLTPLQVDAEVLKQPNGIVCDCGYVPRIEMEVTRSRNDASEASKEVGYLPRDEDLEVLATTLCYVREFLAKPHPVVGRGGPVCPFIPKTLKLDCLYLAVLRVREGFEVEEVANAAKAKFMDLQPSEGNMKFFRAIVLVFPDVPVKKAYEIIDATQDRLKDDFVKEGLMLGEFHLLNNSAGLRNPEFFSIADTIPMPCLAAYGAVRSAVPESKARVDKGLLGSV